MVEDGPRGMVDPAFAAHAGPIGKWAEAVWCNWFHNAALSRLVEKATRKLQGRSSPWPAVTGPAAAFVASAWRLGWVVHDFASITTDTGLQMDMRRDSPEFIKSQVQIAVRRWRWRRIEEKLPSLSTERGGHGAFMAPLHRLMASRSSAPDWGPKQQGALRSLVSNRQWTQCRLWKAGLARTRNCRLCVAYGLCTEDDDDPRHRGTPTHRYWTCPVLQPERERLVPSWLLRDVRSQLDEDNELPGDQYTFLTRALLKSPASQIPEQEPEATFDWHQRPAPELQGCTWYSDGSRLDGGQQYAGMCARHGWAIAAVDQEGQVVATASGRPPRWADGIFGAE
eukprot:12211286-Karenia_brevis.AAC.1